jgi:peptide/nickel transport system substrate-binding protein
VVVDQSTVLRVALSQEIDHLNPFTAVKEAATMVGRLVWEFLTPPRADDLTPTGGLANSWKYAPDGLTWTFTIRPGVVWSDGVPVTAHDAVFTLQRIMTDTWAAEANGNYVANFAEVSAPDERTLLIRTKRPQASMTALDVPIVPAHVWSCVDDMTDPATDTVAIVGVGDGPFLVREYRPDELLVLRANPDYWRGRAELDEVHFVTYPSADAAIEALRAGEVDIVNRLTSVQFESLRGTPGVALVRAVSRRYSHMLLNPGARTRDGEDIGDGHPALRDVRVRRVIAKAVDLEVIRDEVFGGYGRLAGGLIPPIFDRYHWSPDEGTRYPFDIAGAAADLEAAGYPERGGIRVDATGTPVVFRLYWRAGTDYHKLVARRVTGWLGELGIEVVDEGLPDPELERRTTSGCYDLVVAGWGCSPDPDYILSKQTSGRLPVVKGGSSTSASFFSDERFDGLYARQLAELDPSARAELVRQAQARYYDQVPSIVLCYPEALEAYRSDRFADFPRQPAGTGPIMEQSGSWAFYGARPTVSTG